MFTEKHLYFKIRTTKSAYLPSHKFFPVHKNFFFVIDYIHRK